MRSWPNLSPAGSDAVQFVGAIPVDVDNELGQLGPDDYRPLRREEPEGSS
jgi:hypothetical protein